jgi:hypothetical protein
MRSTELITHPAGAETAEPAPHARPEAEPPTADEMLRETLDLVEALPVYGPPAILLVGPLVLLGLILAGPFLALLTIVTLLAAATILVALAGAVLASPYLLVHHLRGRRAGARSDVSGPVRMHSRRAAA